MRRVPSTGVDSLTATCEPTKRRYCVGRAQDTLDARARHLEVVAAGRDQVLALVERGRQRVTGIGQRVEVNALRPVHQDPDDASGHLDVPQLEAGGGDEGLGQLADALGPVPSVTLLVKDRKQKRGRPAQAGRPTPVLLGAPPAPGPGASSSIGPAPRWVRAESGRPVVSRRGRRWPPGRARRPLRARPAVGAPQAAHGDARARPARLRPRRRGRPSGTMANRVGGFHRRGHTPASPSTVDGVRRRGAGSASPSRCAGRHQGGDRLDDGRASATEVLRPHVPADQRDLAVGQVTGADLDPHRDALELPVHRAPAEADLGPVVEPDPDAGAASSSTSAVAAARVSSSSRTRTTTTWTRRQRAAAGAARRRRRGP